jgi:hypothetical protein
MLPVASQTVGDEWKKVFLLEDLPILSVSLSQQTKGAAVMIKAFSNSRGNKVVGYMWLP